LNQVRIIGGRWRRRVLRFPDALGLRPTPDRVRETLFNWLGQDLDGLSCLDLFAGSGALGFEAVSRGAREVTLVEQAAPVVRALHQQVRDLDFPASPALRIEHGDALQFAARCRSAGQRFDVVFLDPPYRLGWWAKLLPLVDDLVKETGRLYMECEVPVTPPAGWVVYREGKAGQVFFHLFERDHERDVELPYAG
jgi:16S rRNA (guanine966-N2)-methyltransferase